VRCRSAPARPAASPSSTRSTRRRPDVELLRQPVPRRRERRDDRPARTSGRRVTSGAITAAYAAEATEASDNAPTLAQPDIIVEKAQAFVPFSIELGQDWGSAGRDGGLLQDAKDDLEATKFALGAGHGSTEPKGIITGATATSRPAAPARSRSPTSTSCSRRSRAVPAARAVDGNLFTIDKIRQFDTAGGSGVWLDNDGSDGTRGLGPGRPRPARSVGRTRSCSAAGFWESTAMASALTTGSKILVDRRLAVLRDRRPGRHGHRGPAAAARRQPPPDRPARAVRVLAQLVRRAVGAAFQVLVTG
jgi:hypothetical protein